MTERTQDAWRVIVNFRDENRMAVFENRIEGIVDLPRPMVPLDAADHALRAVVEMANELRKANPLERDTLAHIQVDIWGRADIGSEPMRLCSAVAQHVPGLGKYMRYTPWDVRTEHEDIKDPEGAAIMALAAIV